MTLDAETAHYLGSLYQAKRKAALQDLQFWGDYVPAEHQDRIRRMAEDYKKMANDMLDHLRLVKPYYYDPEQVQIWIDILERND